MRVQIALGRLFGQTEPDLWLLKQTSEVEAQEKCAKIVYKDINSKIEIVVLRKI